MQKSYVWTCILVILCVLKMSTSLKISPECTRHSQLNVPQLTDKSINNLTKPLECSQTYTKQKLLDIAEACKHNKFMKLLPYETVINVRKLGLNKKRRYRKRGERGGTKQGELRIQNEMLAARKVNFSSLVKIKPITDRHPNERKLNMTAFLVNIWSLKGKCLPLSTYISDSDIDFGIITETWLSDSDNIWINACDLNKNGYKLSPVNRNQRRGGGVALVCTSTMNAKLIDSGSKQSFEYCIWKLNVNNTPLHIVGIYHPPSSTVNRASNGAFIDDFLEFLTDLLTDCRNIILLGDFNMHIEDSSDTEAQTFAESVEALGLTQHVNFTTHVEGNILDLVYTKMVSAVKITSCKQGPFFSDHCLILCETTIEKQAVTKK